jgi:predicted nucleic acid-binding protein
LTTTALDTNIVLDILTGTPSEVAQSEAALKSAQLAGTLSISIIVYAEVASNFPTRSSADDFFRLLNCKIEPVEQATAYLAAQFFWQDRLRGGSRTRILPDFLIAAHAQLNADRILTRDKRFFSDTFPRLKAVSPADLV